MKKTISLLTIVFSFYAFGQENCDTLFIKYDDRLLEKRQHPCAWVPGVIAALVILNNPDNS